MACGHRLADRRRTLAAGAAVNRAGQRAFTLLELLAALAVLAVTFFVLMGGIGQATHALLQDQRATRMALQATSLLDDSLHSALRPSTVDGQLPDGTHWRLVISALGAANQVQLYRLDLTLQAARHAERFSTLRAQSVAGTLK